MNRKEREQLGHAICHEELTNYVHLSRATG